MIKSTLYKHLMILVLISSFPAFAVQKSEKPRSESHQHDDLEKQESHKEDNHIDDHSDDHGKETDQHQDEGLVALDINKLKSADILVNRIDEEVLITEIIAPGEVVINKYRSSKVTPRIQAQVIARHKRLGDLVKKGESLLELSSVDMAQAQGNLLVTYREWKRVEKLGTKVISSSRYTEVQVKYQQAFAKVLAFGMTRTQVKSLLKQNDVTQMTGNFKLLAQQNGTIIKDDFLIGEIIESGRILFEITDETSLWVEAHLSPTEAKYIVVGATANVLIGTKNLPGKVVQILHKLDEKTRTFPIRIEVPNNQDLIHPGQFVEAKIQSQQKALVLAVPQEAVLRSSDGDWVVFVEVEPGQYRAKEIERVRTVNNLVVIKGIESGSRIVTQGAFFVQSELAKSGFDVHNH